MKIIYDKPIEVTKKQYQAIIREFAGIVAHRVKDGKYYIKVWLMKYANDIKNYLR